MSKIDPNYFCIVPFVQLNTRGKGDARICCNISDLNFGIPKDLTLNDLNKTNYSPQTEVFDLNHDSIDDFWNSKFLKDFRMKMLNGEQINQCRYCYSAEKSGLTSRRTNKNKKFFKFYESVFDNIYKNGGHISQKPKLWEVRLSTKCNLSCVICGPNLSTKIEKEYKKWGEQLTSEMKSCLDLATAVGSENLSESKFFREQVLRNLNEIYFLELRGGEVFSDKSCIEFLTEISNTIYAKNIIVDISTNATLINVSIINLLNKFKGGHLRFSIDAYGIKNDYIRYHSNFQKIEQSLELSLKLNKTWTCLLQTTLQLLNCLCLEELLIYLDNFCAKHNFKNFSLGFSIVRGKPWLRHEMIPLLQRRNVQAEMNTFLNSSWLCSNGDCIEINREAMLGLISSLGEPQSNNKAFKKMARCYFQKLNKLRGIDYWKVFPHLECLK